MWLFTSKGFLSVVAPSAFDPAVSEACKRLGGTPGKIADDNLLVRARRKGQIETLFPHAKVIKVTGRDYLYRALVDRGLVAAALADYVASIRYTNFKDSVKDHDLHDACSRVWGVMHSYQSAERTGLETRQRAKAELDDLDISESPGFRRVVSRSPIVGRPPTLAGDLGEYLDKNRAAKAKPVLPGNTKKGRR